jgi:hypothetical protein
VNSLLRVVGGLRQGEPCTSLARCSGARRRKRKVSLRGGPSDSPRMGCAPTNPALRRRYSVRFGVKALIWVVVGEPSGALRIAFALLRGTNERRRKRVSLRETPQTPPAWGCALTGFRLHDDEGIYGSFSCSDELVTIRAFKGLAFPETLRSRSLWAMSGRDGGR